MSLKVHAVAIAIAIVAAPGQAAGATPPLRAEGPSSVSRTDTTVRRGGGLIAAGALLGGLGLATNLVRVGLSRRLCRDVSYNAATGALSGAELCLIDTRVLQFLSPGALAINTTAFALLAAGGHMHGRWAAQWDPAPKRLPRRGAVRIGVGAALMAAGLIGYGVARVTSYADMLGYKTCSARHDFDADDPDPANSPLVRCLRERYTGYLIGISLTQAASVIGVGVLSQGASFRRHSRAFEVAARHHLQLQPVLSPRWAGLTLSGRF